MEARDMTKMETLITITILMVRGLPTIILEVEERKRISSK